MTVASAVGICNLSLANIGQTADVNSISPPDPTVRAQKCAEFYPIARDALLEAHAWSFNTRRVALAEVDNNLNSWRFAYAVPSLCVKPLAVLMPQATDDTKTQPFTLETDDSGNQVIYTNVEDAVLRFQVAVTNTSKFTPLFVTTLSWLLSSYVAGAIIKGAAGVKVGDFAFQRFGVEFSKATTSNANAAQDDSYAGHKPAWISDR